MELKSSRTSAKRELTVNGEAEHIAPSLRVDSTLVSGGKGKRVFVTRDALIAYAGCSLKIVARVLHPRGRLRTGLVRIFSSRKKVCNNKWWRGISLNNGK